MEITHQCTECTIAFHGQHGNVALVDHFRLVHQVPTVQAVRLVDNRRPTQTVAGCERCELALDIRGGPEHRACTSHGAEHCSAEGCF